MPELKLFAGRSNPRLAERIAKLVGQRLGECQIRNFSDGEIWVKYAENIRGSDVFIIQSTNPPADNLMELLILVDAARRASARRVTAVIPYFGYGRQDRKLLFGRPPAIDLFVPLPGRAIPFFPTRACPPTESKCAAGRRHCPTICASGMTHDH